MVIKYVASADDISRVRFAPSPIGEAVLSIRMMATASRRSPHQPWIHDVMPKLGGIDFRALRALVPPTGYVPDFLTPPPGADRLDVDAQLEFVRATDPDKLVDELSWMTTDPVTSATWKASAVPTYRRMLDAPERAIGEIVDLLAAYWRVALGPYWQRMHDGLQTDVRSRMQVIEKSGIAAVFSSLNQRIGWHGDGLSVDSSYDFSVEMGGQGLVLVPSTFCFPEVLTMLPPLQSMIIYPNPGRRDLWESSHVRDTRPLAALLGPVRAAVMEALTTPASTGELAAQLGVTPGAVSQHLGVLRDCGLVTSRRAGRRMLHSITMIGEDLVRSARPTARNWLS